MLASLPASLVLSLLLSAPFTSARVSRRDNSNIPSPHSAPKNAILPIIVHHVDPSSPSQSAQSVLMADEQLDAPNFGSRCQFTSTFATCGDYFSEETGVDHGLFCSPSGICAGKGAACGSSESCAEGLSCNFMTHRCVISSTLRLSVSALRTEERRKAAHSSCPEGTEACSSGLGGFECVDTLTDVNECGGCHTFGGVSCSTIEGALATSCRDGGCVVHACTGGFTLREDGSGCDEDDEGMLSE